MPEMHLILLLCLCFPEIWKSIYYQRTRSSPSPTHRQLHRTLSHTHNTKELCFNTLESTTTTGCVDVSATELDHGGPSQFLVKLSFVALLCAITGQSTVVPFRVCPNCVLGVRRSADVRRLAEEFFIDPTLRYLVSFLLRNLVGYSTVCLLRPFKVCGHRFFLSETEACFRHPVRCQLFTLVC